MNALASGDYTTMMTHLQEEAQRATKEVAYNMKQRVRQELAYPAVVHFYTWLLHGAALTGSISQEAHATIPCSYDGRVPVTCVIDKSDVQLLDHFHNSVSIAH